MQSRDRAADRVALRLGDLHGRIAAFSDDGVERRPVAVDKRNVCACRKELFGSRSSDPSGGAGHKGGAVVERPVGHFTTPEF